MLFTKVVYGWLKTAIEARRAKERENEWKKEIDVDSKNPSAACEFSINQMLPEPLNTNDCLTIITVII